MPASSPWVTAVWRNQWIDALRSLAACNGASTSMASPAYLEAQGHPQTVSDLADHRLMCLRGNDLAYLSHFVVAEDFARGDLVTVMDALIVRPSPREAVSAVYYRNSGIALRIQVLMDFFAPRFGLVGCQ